MKTKNLSIILIGVAGILMIPFIWMQFRDEVVWSAFDFIIAGILLLGIGLAIDLVLRKVSSTRKRFIVWGIILVLFFLVWAELAVGVFGTPFAGS